MVIDRKILVLFFAVVVVVVGVFALLGGLSARQQYCYIYNAPAQAATAPKGLNLPMPKPSTITTERDNVRLDLESVNVHQYYIVYSVIYGDESHTAYHLFLTDLQKRELDLAGITEIWLETDKGERIEQIAEPAIYEYPEDQPLKWKIGVVAKFPHQVTRDNHKLFLRYHGKTFQLNGIRY